MIPKNDVPAFLGNVIDIFEDFLEDKQVEIQNIDRDIAMIFDGEENPAIIYGDDYGTLQDALIKLMVAWGVIKEE